MEKRINIICNYSSLYAGNFIPSILKLCEKLDFEVIVFSFPVEAENRNWVEYIKSKGYKVFFYRKKFFNKDIKLINSRNSINVIYTHFISGLKIKMVVPFNRRIKLFIHVHSDFSGNKKISLKRRIITMFERMFIRTDAIYIFVSKPLCLKSKFKHRFFVQNALCLDRIVARELNIDDFLKRNNIHKQDTIFLLFGWSPYVKGVDLAVKSFMSVPDDLQNKAKLIIVHGKDDGKRECINYLVDRLHDKSFLNNQNIIFIPPEEDVFSLYNISDIYIMASRSEGFSYSTLESLFFNLLCIVNDIEGVAWAKQFKSCLFFKRDSVIDLANLIKKCIGTKSLHKKKNDIAKKYDIEEWANKIKTILNT